MATLCQGAGVDRVGVRVGPLGHSAIPGLELGVILSAPPIHYDVGPSKQGSRFSW